MNDVGYQPIRQMNVASIPEYIEAVSGVCSDWSEDPEPWFRGEGARFDTPLQPMLFRADHDENSLLQFFRSRSPGLDLPIVPLRHEIDKWLYLARHFGLPTRLLDWTEGALIALFFALKEDDPLVWVLDPLALNRKTDPESVPNMPVITWAKEKDSGNRNIRAAWGEHGELGTEIPVAVPPAVVHRRMSVQRSNFTIHGADHRPLGEIVGGECLTRIGIQVDPSQGFRELRRLGISDSTLFPDLEGLARELKSIY